VSGCLCFNGSDGYFDPDGIWVVAFIGVLSCFYMFLFIYFGYPMQHSCSMHGPMTTVASKIRHWILFPTKKNTRTKLKLSQSFHAYLSALIQEIEKKVPTGSFSLLFDFLFPIQLLRKSQLLNDNSKRTLI